MAIRASVDRALKLFEEATAISQRIGQAIKDGTADLTAADAQAVHEQLNSAMERAQTAHDNLDAAIKSRLGDNGGGA